MIFQRALLREFSQTAAAVFVALVAVLLSTQLVRLLGQAASGRITSESVIALLGFGALGYLPMVLSLTAFIAVLLTLSRAWRDSEMAVWFASGQPLTAWLMPVLRFVLPLALVVGLMTLFLSPWAVSKSTEYRNRIESRDDVARVTPGAFNESTRADRVFFVGNVSDEAGRVKNVFVSSLQHGRLGVMAAAEGYTETMANGDRFLVLDQGRRYEWQPGSAEYRVMEFDRYAVRIETREARQLDPSPKSRPLWELLREPTPAHRGELVWRFGVPLLALNLALLAIPLSFVNPRSGRTNHLMLALLAYFTYSNLLGVSQAWVAQGRIGFQAGLIGVHGLMFAVLLLLFAHHLRLHSRLLPRFLRR